MYPLPLAALVGLGWENADLASHVPAPRQITLMNAAREKSASIPAEIAAEVVEPEKPQGVAHGVIALMGWLAPGARASAP